MRLRGYTLEEDENRRVSYASKRYEEESVKSSY